MAKLTTAIPAFLKADAWKNQKIKLYHGTIDYYSTSIQTKVDHTQGKPRTDFAPGFYTTTNLDQAKSWAWDLLGRSIKKKKFAHVDLLRAEVIEFVVARDGLATLDTLCFVLGNRNIADFWSFVWHCRNGATDHQVTFTRNGVTENVYDLVIGPVASQWRIRQAIQDTDQFSFHSTNGTDVLNDKATTKRVCWRHP